MPVTDLALITVTGKFLMLNGSAAAGTVTFTPSVVLTNPVANEIVHPVPFTATLNAAGAFSIQLPATNDPDLTPVGWTYSVTENIVGSTPRTYLMEVPYNQAGGTLDLADVVPAVPTSAVSSYVLVSTFNTHLSGAAGHTAANISFSPTGTVAATNVQAAIAEVASEGGGGGAHPDVATHDAMGLATDAYVDATAGVTVQDEGSPLAGGSATAMNFVGAGVTASGSGRTKTITIPGGGGGGGSDLRLRVDDYGADPTGVAFSDAAFLAVANAVRSTGGTSGHTVALSRGTYKLANVWDLADIQGVTFEGVGGQTNPGGTANSATTILCTGTGPYGIDARSAIGCVFKNVQIAFNNAAFCGTLVDFGRYQRPATGVTFVAGSTNVTSSAPVFSPNDVGRLILASTLAAGGQAIQTYVSPTQVTMFVGAATSGTVSASVNSGDSGYCWVRDCNLTGIGTKGGSDGTGGSGALRTQISRLLGFCGGTIGGVERTTFYNAGRAVDGTYAGDPAPGYSNVITVRECTFAAMKQAFIWNAGLSWTIEGNTFESHSATPNNPAYDEDAGGASSGVVFKGNWCGDGTPDFWIRIGNGKGWEIAGNYLSSFADDPAGATIRLVNATSGVHILSNYFRGNSPPFDANSNNAGGAFGCSAIVFTGNRMADSGIAPTNYTNLYDVAIFGNRWPSAAIAPGGGWYVTDADGTVLSGGGSGGAHPDLAAHDTLGLATQAELDAHAATAHGTGTSTQIINAHDYLPQAKAGTGTAETLANINAFKTAMDGRVVVFPRNPNNADYNFANIGATGFFLTKPTLIFGPGVGNDQVTGGQWVSRLVFPNGVTGFTFSGGGAQGGAINSRLQDLYIKGPVLPGLGTNDGVRLRAGSFRGDNVMVEGFSRDGWNTDTDDNTNVNVSALTSCKAYFAQRYGFYTVGTNSNVITFTSCDANNCVQYGFYTGGPPTNGGTGAGGGYTNTFIGCHGSNNQQGGFYDDGNSNTYIGCYLEDTRTNYANSWRMVIGPNAADGIVHGIAFGGFPVLRPATALGNSWRIDNPWRNLPAEADSGVREILGSRGGNVALTNWLAAEEACWRVRDSTTA